MDSQFHYYCKYPQCLPEYAKTLEGLAIVKLLELLVFYKKRPECKKNYKEIRKTLFHLYDSLQKVYKFTAIVKNLCVQGNFDFREEVIDMNLPSIVHYIQLNNVAKIFFTNLTKNSKFFPCLINGEASPDCPYHESEYLEPWFERFFRKNTFAVVQFNIVSAMKRGEWAKE